MVAQLYIDDPSSTTMTIERATAQAERMLTEPWLAHPLLVIDGGIVGYVVLVPFYSNEYGGIVGVPASANAAPTAASSALSTNCSFQRTIVVTATARRSSSR